MTVAAVLYGLNTLLVKRMTDNWFAHSYLNDLFAMPFMLAYSNRLVSLWRSGCLMLTTPLRIGLMTIICSVVWECAGPFLKSTSVFDPIDFIAYGTGSFIYFGVLHVRVWNGRSALRCD